MNGNKELSTPSVANVSELETLRATDYGDGAAVYVLDVQGGNGGLFFLVKSSTATADGVNIVAPAPNQGEGRWIGYSGNAVGPVPSTQDVWYVNAATGDDANDGATALTAVRTYAEVLKRFGGSFEMVGRDVLIYQIGPSAESLGMTASFPPDSSLTFEAVPVVVTTGTIDSVQVYDSSVPELGEIDSGDIPDWSVHAGQLIRLTSGTNDGAVAWITASTNVAAGTARYSPFVRPDTGAVVDPQVGDEFEILDTAASELTGAWSVVTSGQSTPTAPKVRFSFFDMSTSTELITTTGGVDFFGCKNPYAQVQGGQLSLTATYQDRNFAPSSSAQGTYAINGGYILGPTTYTVPGEHRAVFYNLSLFDGATLSVEGGTRCLVSTAPALERGIAFENEVNPLVVEEGAQLDMGAVRAFGLSATGTVVRVDADGSLIYTETLEPNFTGVPVAYANIGGTVRTEVQITGGRGYVEAANLARMVART